MVVQFNDVGEFLKELVGDQAAVARKRVRVTQLYRQMPAGITRLSVVATAKVLSTSIVAAANDFDLVRLETVIGDLWGHAEDENVKTRAHEIVDQIERDAAAAGFVVAAGVYQVDAPR